MDPILACVTALFLIALQGLALAHSEWFGMDSSPVDSLFETFHVPVRWRDLPEKPMRKNPVVAFCIGAAASLTIQAQASALSRPFRGVLTSLLGFQYSSLTIGCSFLFAVLAFPVSEALGNRHDGTVRSLASALTPSEAGSGNLSRVNRATRVAFVVVVWFAAVAVAHFAGPMSQPSSPGVVADSPASAMVHRSVFSYFTGKHQKSKISVWLSADPVAENGLIAATVVFSIGSTHAQERRVHLAVPSGRFVGDSSFETKLHRYSLEKLEFVDGRAVIVFCDENCERIRVREALKSELRSAFSWSTN